MFCASEHVFEGTEGVRSCFHVLRARTNIRRKQGRRVPFSSFALLESFPEVVSASGSVFMFCAPGLLFGGTEDVGSRFHVLRSRTRFRRYGGRRDPFLYFALLESFPAVPCASGPIFMFCAPGLFFGGNKGVGSRFQVLRSYSRLPRYRRRRVPFSCFAHPDLFSAVPRVTTPVLMFCVPTLVFGGIESVVSSFPVLRSRTRFPRSRRRQVPFSWFACRD
jgi:hypothetical protein